jgi:hypothetical protein
MPWGSSKCVGVAPPPMLAWNRGPAAHSANLFSEVSLSLHAVLQMLSNETFITFRVRAPASSLMDWALASIA